MSVIFSKNTSPRKLALFNALIMGLILALLAYFLNREWYVVLGVALFSFTCSYFLYYFTLQFFIYRKIKLIYKFIFKTKATKREEFFYKEILPQKSIEDVSKDVQKWAVENNDKIELLQKNEQFRKEFLINLAHELRTPIFTIQGYVHTLLDGALEDKEVNYKFLNNAAKGIDRLVRLVDDLDQISKLEYGKIQLNMQTFVIQDVVKDIFDELTLIASDKSIRLEIKKGTEHAILVNADKEKIHQVLMNLIMNAIKYSKPECVISCGFYIMHEGHVYVEVNDDGPGIGEEHLPRLFERFYRADRSRNSGVGGTGLGLAIVKHIIEAHGQTVTVRSKIGVGSSFGFTLNRT